MIKIITIISIVIFTSSCSNLGVKPWERGVLARADMAITPSNNDITDDHIYFSKESSSGGRGFAGGGCGCN